MTQDLMFADAVHDLVADAYQALAEPGAPGANHYSPEQLAELPEGARLWALGVGNPVRHAALRPGDRVVDLGCGAGIDSLLAARMVGPAGAVTGIDFLQDMVERACTFAKEAGLGNVEFLRGYMEALPLSDESADVVISNGAINLTPRKSRVLAEAFRVLVPGGHMTVCDLVVQEKKLPSEILTHPSAWAG